MIYLNFVFLEEKVSIKDLIIFTVENVQVFSKVVQELYNYENGYIKLFTSNYKSIKSSEIMLITDVLSFEVNSRANLKLIYQDLEVQLNYKPEIKSKIDYMLEDLLELIGHELVEHELELKTEEINIQDLFAIMGIKIEINNSTIFEKILSILQIYKYLPKLKILVFVNIASYLTHSELKVIKEHVSLMNKEVIMLEPRVLPSLYQYTLDKDYCFMEINML